MAREQRAYPMACRSLYCGEVACPSTCPHLPELQAFKEWKERTNAEPVSIWSPCIYEGISDRQVRWEDIPPVPSTIPVGFA